MREIRIKRERGGSKGKKINGRGIRRGLTGIKEKARDHNYEARFFCNHDYHDILMDILINKYG